MNRYEEVFASLKKRNEIAFIPFAVAGDPDIDISEEIFGSYVAGGADILEIGYPFSDPIADGPVNQRAAQRAIAAGLRHASFFDLVKRIRSRTDIPIGLLSYANSVYHLGYDTFCKKAAGAGIDSLLVADMPPEESHELQKSMKRYGIGRVFIVTELTPITRMQRICDQIDSFVYVVSRLGTTGVGTSMNTDVATTLSRLRSVTDKPLAVGFGISTPSHVSMVRQAGADAAIVGSALVSQIERSLLNKKSMMSLLKKSVVQFKLAARRG